MKFRIPLVALVLTEFFFFTSLMSAAEAPNKKWSDTGELSLVSANGNSRTTTTAAKNTFTYKWTMTALELMAGGLGSQNQDQVTAEEYFASEKVAYSLTEKNYVFEKYRWDKNRFAGIRHRHDIGLGVGREFIKTNSNHLIGELGGGYINEERTVGPRNDFASGRAYAKFLHTFTPTASISQDAEYLANFENSSDFRVNTETALISSLSVHFSLKVSYKWKYVGEPPAGFGRHDTITAIAFIANY